MSSVCIVPSVREIVHRRIEPAIPVKWQHQFRFGLQALTFRPFTSLASNARQTVANRSTASTKMDRLVQNGGLATTLSQTVQTLGFLKPTSIVACDHSDFNGLLAFVGAVQTNQGRAVPCLITTTYASWLSPWEHGQQRVQQLRAHRDAAAEPLSEHAFQSLKTLATELGFWPKLVFDRGFGGLPFIRALVEHHVTFYVRLKANRLVELSGDRYPVARLTVNDAYVRLGGLLLRVVRSDDPATGEPWYILTSDRTTTRDKVIAIYAHRFEIEETFKDLKHILELERTRLNHPESLRVLLWFASLAVILAFLVRKWTVSPHQTHPKKQLSYVRQFFEALYRELLGPLFTQITGAL